MRANVFMAVPPSGESDADNTIVAVIDRQDESLGSRSTAVVGGTVFE
jgi:hypothetical protein